MTPASHQDAGAPPQDRERWARFGAPLLAGTSVLALVIGVLLGWTTFAAHHPGDDSAEAGFARDMSEHHAQAVEMSLLVMQRTEDPAMRRLSYDIASSQANQIGQMEGWLRTWGVPAARGADRMEWMAGHEAHDGHAMEMEGSDSTMPGMATSAELDQLRGSTGAAAEELFLKLMTTHHIAGVDMAEAAVDLVRDPEVLRLARAMAASQQSEIDAMTQLLAERDAAPGGPPPGAGEGTDDTDHGDHGDG